MAEKELRQVDDRHPRAFGRKSTSDRAPEPLSTARDEGVSILQPGQDEPPRVNS